jgi:trigger factor
MDALPRLGGGCVSYAPAGHPDRWNVRKPHRGWRKIKMSMQIIEKSGEGLSKVYGVTVPATELTQKLNAKIEEIRPRMQIKGFRPGKVPAMHVKKMYGKSLMSEIVDQAVTEGRDQALNDNKLRAAASPDISLSSDIDKVLAGESDLAFDLSVEVMPEFTPVVIEDIKLTRPVHAPTEKEIDEQLAEIAKQNLSYEVKTGKAVKAAVGDMVVADFVGRIDGEAFEGGSMEGADIVIGSNRFIPGFEDQLKGAKSGATLTIKVTFPDDYGAEALRGKAAEFETQVKEIKAPKQAAVDDDLAKALGLENLDALKEAVKGQLEQQYAQASRFKTKRALLDVLDEAHDFPLPPRMVESEFGAIWQQVEAEKERGELSEEDKGKSDDELKAEYKKIAERRVRLGLVLAEIGRHGDVSVSEQELAGAIRQEAMKYGAQAQEVFDALRQREDLQAQLRAPIYEEKVVDLILSKAKVTDKKVSKDKLFEEDALPDGYGGA